MDVKSAFLYGKIEEEVYVCQPPRFEDPDIPDRVKGDILLVQVYVDDIIFGLQVKQKKDDIFICQDKYVAKILKKFGFTDVTTASPPMETQKPLINDEDGEEVNVHMYRSMIGSLMYLTSSRPDITFAVCACARYQVNTKVSHLHAVKRIFKYLKGQPRLGLWYIKYSPFDFVAYTNSDYAGASLDRKSTTGGCQFLRCRLISWQCKKQTLVVNSTTEAEYVAASSCFAAGVINIVRIERVGENKNKKRDVWSKNRQSDLVRKRIERCAVLGNWRCEKVNGEAQIHALIDGKKVIMTEETVRKELQLANEERVNCLPNSTIFEELTRMEYEKISQKLTFYKAFFSPQWKFLIHTVLQCLSAKTTKWNEFSSTMASAIICLATNQKFNFSKFIFEDEALNEEMDDSLVRDATTTTSLDAEIESLERKVNKLEKKDRKRTHKLKRLYKVGLTARVESSEEEDLDDVEMFENDQDVPLNADKDGVHAKDDVTVEEITLAQALQKMKSTTPKAKRVVIRERE
ncbi:hypothetical protein Tco_1304102 [Tanacetum coccineum]